MNEVSHTDADRPKRQLRTLAVDCGGGGIKTSLLDDGGFQIGRPQRTALRYPLTPDNLVEIVSSHAANVEGFERITLGLPGMIRPRGGHDTAHYMRPVRIPKAEACMLELKVVVKCREPPTPARPGGQFNVAALVLNDAEVAAAGVVSGEGVELVITLGTGLGNALIDNGQLAPHLEISHAPMRWGIVTRTSWGRPSAFPSMAAFISKGSRQAILQSLVPVFGTGTMALCGVLR